MGQANRAYNIRVVNMSLGGAALSSYKNDPVCLAVRKLADAGVVVVAAAGNDGKLSSGKKIYGGIHSPGNEPSAITVGASNTYGSDPRQEDTVTSFTHAGREIFRTDNNELGLDNLNQTRSRLPGTRLLVCGSRQLC